MSTTPHLTKRILITGASRGIGLSIAQRFASLGASIILLSRTTSQLTAALATLPAHPTQPHTTITGSVSSVELWETIRRSHKDIDVLINAAGVSCNALLVRTSQSAIAATLETNLLGSIYASRAIGRNMLVRKAGCIVNIGSVLGLHRHIAGSSVYAASKAGVVGFSRALAVEMGPGGVRVNVITPGYVETDMTTGMTGAAREAALGATPAGRFGVPEEVADAVVFLVGNGYMNGAEIVVDGGLGCT
ncbi:hypothetical protein BZA05DRAFT_122739 [Tricharina praecox]|uniref:uncharacterized protein n=1 Tax=Tricharina praecox TaxID=43433 RepID=UPI0022211A68|nr:uncharacterized protein BZA05DRAFT_122739 [Tricharina praecox]KAI5847431.1 hypothetical protein BZA05DRAFT_122739 [Tricharina praecox]